MKSFFQWQVSEKHGDASYISLICLWERKDQVRCVTTLKIISHTPNPIKTTLQEESCQRLCSFHDLHVCYCSNGLKHPTFPQDGGWSSPCSCLPYWLQTVAFTEWRKRKLSRYPMSTITTHPDLCCSRYDCDRREEWSDQTLRGFDPSHFTQSSIYTLPVGINVTNINNIPSFL